MSDSPAGRAFRVACLAAAVLGSAVVSARAQQSSGPNLNVSGNEMAERMELSNKDALGDKDELAAFQAFSNERGAAKKIQLGNNFLKKYPAGKLAERVDSGMMDVYRLQQDWKDEYLFADQALTLKPDDVDVLATVSWTIPHVYNPNDPDADQELDKAEKYAKHAIDVLVNLPKPADMTEAQFGAAKARRTFQAHSALGLVYFRREDYNQSARELALATTGNPVQDQTDLYVLGVDLQNLNRFSEAAGAFHSCGQISGALADPCAKNEAAMQAQSPKPKTP
jgi:hypothetical protein